MAGIAGVVMSGKESLVEHMLDKMAYRCKAEAIVLELGDATIGVVGSRNHKAFPAVDRMGVQDCAGEGHFARARIAGGRFVLERDPLGVAPLYYGWMSNGELCFASEVKALLKLTDEVIEMPPGCQFDGMSFVRLFQLQEQQPLTLDPRTVAVELRQRLDNAVAKCMGKDPIGAWLSGGLDSSTLVALASRKTKKLQTFAGGLQGSPDLEYGAVVADFVGSDHHEATLSANEMLTVLPEVIYHLESFDALLVRSSIINYIVAKAASGYVSEVFSGEGGDELFAGYDYLKALPREALSDELIDITRRLHNTALQRVDRCAAAHGLTAHVCFLDPYVVDYALRIPIEYKIRNGIEKWILREAMTDALPPQVLNRPKAKFWEGTGVGDLLSRHADSSISDASFKHERSLDNGVVLRTKEELMYYRIFNEHFGAMKSLAWMGRTKRAPMSL